MKEQSKAFFSQPFKIGAINRRMAPSQDNTNRATPKKRATSDQPTIRSYAESKPMQKSNMMKPKVGEKNSVPSSGVKVGSHL